MSSYEYDDHADHAVIVDERTGDSPGDASDPYTGEFGDIHLDDLDLSDLDESLLGEDVPQASTPENDVEGDTQTLALYGDGAPWANTAGLPDQVDDQPKNSVGSTSPDAGTESKSALSEDPSMWTDEEERRLGECAATVERFVHAGFEAGRALRIIQEEKLYRKTHRRFNEFVEDRFGIGRSSAYRMIKIARTLDELTEQAKVSKRLDISKLPQLDAHIDQLARLNNPQTRLEAWAQVIELADDGKVTGSLIKRVVDDYRQDEGHRPQILAQASAPTDKSGMDADSDGHSAAEPEADSTAPPATEASTDTEQSGDSSGTDNPLSDTTTAPETRVVQLELDLETARKEVRLQNERNEKLVKAITWLRSQLSDDLRRELDRLVDDC